MSRNSIAREPYLAQIDPMPQWVAVKRLLILGSTGSIGTQALDVVSRAKGAFEVVGLSAATGHDAVDPAGAASTA